MLDLCLYRVPILDHRDGAKQAMATTGTMFNSTIKPIKKVSVSKVFFLADAVKKN